MLSRLIISQRYTLPLDPAGGSAPRSRYWFALHMLAMRVNPTFLTWRCPFKCVPAHDGSWPWPSIWFLDPT